MKNNILMRLLSLVAVLFVVAAMTLSLASCGSTNDPADTNADDAIETSADTAGGTEQPDDKAALITVTVTHGDGSTKVFEIQTTDGETLRAALESIDLVAGEESEYGLYVKVVDGETADYNVDGAYWSFYQDGEYMMSGVDTSYVKDGDTFEIKYAK